MEYNIYSQATVTKVDFKFEFIRFHSFIIIESKRFLCWASEIQMEFMFIF